MDRLTSMAVFTKVVATGSFSKAGRELGLSPAGVSNHIRALEDWLGARLIHRTTRRLSLTEAGEALHERCARILEEVEGAQAAAGALQEAPRGRLKISAPITFGMRHLAPVIADYLLAYPGVAVDVALNDRKVDLLEEGFDLAVRIGELPDSSLAARRLATSRSVLCASPAYVERHGAPGEPAELERHQCLEYAYRATPGQWRFSGPDGEEVSVRIRGRLTSTNGELLRVAALRGLGISVAPTFIVGEDLAAGRLVPLMPRYAPAELGVHAVYPQGRHVPAKVRSFIDFVVSRFGHEPAWDACARSGAAPPAQAARARARQKKRR
ncbi:LysR family transcriptional regulator [Sorangium sp. So ce1151]|uniref:LysR family transcriptional regulator n=1 Tax=Sorangium sp. So ce1151 TaxID=3133332 RepID=UPI003F5DDAC8